MSLRSFFTKRSAEPAQPTTPPALPLPGMEQHESERVVARGEQQGRDLTLAMMEPASINEATARMEARAPLFRGVLEPSQQSLF